MFEFLYPERFVAGTVGLPGQRTFYVQTTGFVLQGSSPAMHESVVSVALEKQAVARLAEWCQFEVEALTDAGLLDRKPQPVSDRRALSTPIEEDFRAADVSAVTDRQTVALTISLFPIEPVQLPFGQDVNSSTGLIDAADDRETDRQPGLKVTLTPAQALGFAVRALSVVAAGRPPCPYCQGPLDLDGHICPRANGYKR